MVSGRALFLLMVLPMAAAATPADAQSRGIQVAPVMVTLSSADSIASLRLRNGRTRPVSFEADVYTWTQVNGEDVLTPTRDVIVAPGVFEIPANSEQVVRLGVQAAASDTERAYRLILRELPAPRNEGTRLSFALEMSLPVFMAPTDSRPVLQTRLEARGADSALVLANAGNAHIQIASVEDMDAGALEAPRYLLAGTSAEIALRPGARSVRLRAAESNGAQTERIVNVDRQTLRASVR